MAIDLTELSRELIMNAVRREYPGFSEIEIKVELFRRFYHDDFDKEEMDKITDQMYASLTEGS